MADRDRRTTTSTTSEPPGTNKTVGTTRRRGGIPSAVWLVIGAVVVVLLILFLFNGGMDSAGDVGDGDATNLTVEGDAASGANDAVEGTADALAVPDGTEAEVVAPPAEAPSN